MGDRERGRTGRTASVVSVSTGTYDYETLVVGVRDHVASVTLNRPEALNAFTVVMRRECRDLWTALRSDDDVRVVVLTGAGDTAFCVGIDRDEPFTALDDSPALYGTSNNFMYDDPGDWLGPKSNNLWKPVIGAVNGMACGGAFYLLGECDVLIAAEHATFFDPHVTFGMPAIYEPMKMLTRMPFGEVMRMSLTGDTERISAETALREGGGVIQVDQEGAEELVFSEQFACVQCGTSLPEIEPRTFSFNSPHGACTECTGLGFKLTVDPDLIIPAFSPAIAARVSPRMAVWSSLMEVITATSGSTTLVASRRPPNPTSTVW